jgi:hypothetical protein
VGEIEKRSKEGSEMLEQAAYQSRGAHSSISSADDPLRARYQLARNRGRRGQLWSKVAGGSRSLLDLKRVTVACQIVARRDAGRRLVPVAQIRGSEGRVDDFDRDFNPLSDRTRKRWLGIAAARERGKALPPVSLVKVGEVYFVTDGHHRISVASAFGQEEVEARVTEWELEGPLPWEKVEARAGRVQGAFSRLRQALAATS